MHLIRVSHEIGESHRVEQKILSGVIIPLHRVSSPNTAIIAIHSSGNDLDILSQTISWGNELMS